MIHVRSKKKEELRSIKKKEGKNLLLSLGVGTIKQKKKTTIMYSNQPFQNHAD